MAAPATGDSEPLPDTLAMRDKWPPREARTADEVAYGEAEDDDCSVAERRKDGGLISAPVLSAASVLAAAADAAAGPMVGDRVANAAIADCPMLNDVSASLNGSSCASCASSSRTDGLPMGECGCTPAES